MAIAMPMCARQTFDTWLETASENELQKGVALYQQAALQIAALLEEKRRVSPGDAQDTARLVCRMEARKAAIAARRAQLLF